MNCYYLTIQMIKFHFFENLELCNTHYYKWDEKDKKLKDLGVAQNVF